MTQTNRERRIATYRRGLIDGVTLLRDALIRITPPEAHDDLRRVADRVIGAGIAADPRNLAQEPRNAFECWSGGPEGQRASTAPLARSTGHAGIYNNTRGKG